MGNMTGTHRVRIIKILPGDAYHQADFRGELEGKEGVGERIQKSREGYSLIFMPDEPLDHTNTHTFISVELEFLDA